MITLAITLVSLVLAVLVYCFAVWAILLFQMENEP